MTTTVESKDANELAKKVILNPNRDEVRKHIGIAYQRARASCRTENTDYVFEVFEDYMKHLGSFSHEKNVEELVVISRINKIDCMFGGDFSYKAFRERRSKRT